MYFSRNWFLLLATLCIAHVHQVHSLEPEIRTHNLTNPSSNSFNVNIYDSLYEAIKMDSSFEVKMFIEFGANVNYRYSDGKTPLMIASSIGNLNTVRILLELGADTNLESNTGMTAMDYANKIDEKLIVHALKNRTGSKPTVSSTNVLEASDIIITEDIPDQH